MRVHVRPLRSLECLKSTTPETFSFLPSPFQLFPCASCNLQRCLRLASRCAPYSQRSSLSSDTLGDIKIHVPILDIPKIRVYHCIRNHCTPIENIHNYRSWNLGGALPFDRTATLSGCSRPGPKARAQTHSNVLAEDITCIHA